MLRLRRRAVLPVPCQPPSVVRVAVVAFVLHVSERETERSAFCMCAVAAKAGGRRTCQAGDVSLVSDGFSLVRRVGGPDDLRANGAHAPHGGEQRFKRELSFSPPLSLWLSRSRHRGIRNPSAFTRVRARARARAAPLLSRVPLCRDERRARENTSSPSGGSAEAFSQLAVMARPAASVSVN